VSAPPAAMELVATSFTATRESRGGIRAYETPKGWHLVTFGLTELFAKESEDPRVSGWGYELTLRTPAADEPQGRAMELLAVAHETQEQASYSARATGSRCAAASVATSLR
jgi:hypothetical protein